MNYYIIIGALFFLGAFTGIIYYFHKWMILHDEDHIKKVTESFLKTNEFRLLIKQAIFGMAENNLTFSWDLAKSISRNEEVVNQVAKAGSEVAKEIIKAKKKEIETQMFDELKKIDTSYQYLDQKVKSHENAYDFLCLFLQKNIEGKPQLNKDIEVDINIPHTDENGYRTFENKRVSLYQIIDSFITVDEFMKEYELGFIEKRKTA